MAAARDDVKKEMAAARLEILQLQRRIWDLESNNTKKRDLPQSGEAVDAKKRRIDNAAVADKERDAAEAKERDAAAAKEQRDAVEAKQHAAAAAKQREAKQREAKQREAAAAKQREAVAATAPKTTIAP